MTIDIIIVIVLVILGIALLLAEIFLLPGITIAGIAGSLSLGGGIVYAFMGVGNTAGFVTIASSIVLFAGTFIFLIKSNTMSQIALNTDIEAKVDQSDLKLVKVGDVGKTISRLNPIGKAEFNGIIVEAKSITGEFIEERMSVVIVKVETYNILVKLVEA